MCFYMQVLCDILADNNGIKKLQVNINGVGHKITFLFILFIKF